MSMLEAPGLVTLVWTSSQNFMCLIKVLELYPKRLGSWRQRRPLTEVHKKQPDVGRHTSTYHSIEYLKCIQFLLGHNLEMSHYLRYSETVVWMDVYICIISSFGTLILLGSLESKGWQVRRHLMLNHISGSALRILNSYAFIIVILSQKASLLHAKCEWDHRRVFSGGKWDEHDPRWVTSPAFKKLGLSFERIGIGQESHRECTLERNRLKGGNLRGGGTGCQRGERRDCPSVSPLSCESQCKRTFSLSVSCQQKPKMPCMEPGERDAFPF